MQFINSIPGDAQINAIAISIAAAIAVAFVIANFVFPDRKL